MLIVYLETCEWAGQGLCRFHERESGHIATENRWWIVYSFYIWGISMAFVYVLF